MQKKTIVSRFRDNCKNTNNNLGFKKEKFTRVGLELVTSGLM